MKWQNITKFQRSFFKVVIGSEKFVEVMSDVIIEVSDVNGIRTDPNCMRTLYVLS